MREPVTAHHPAHNPGESRPSDPVAPSHPPEDEAIDRALVSRLQSAARGGGPADKSAWTALIERHQQRIYLTCLRYCNNPETALDLTQDVFVKVIQSIDGFDRRSQLTTWMTRIAINVCLSHRRSARVRRTVSLSEDAAPSRAGGSHGRGSSRTLQESANDHNYINDNDLRLSNSAGTSENFGGGARSGSGGTGGTHEELSPNQSVEWEERRTRLYSALAELPPEQRALLILRDVQGFEYEQIAEVLGVPLGPLKRRLFRARLALRELMEVPGSPDSHH